MKLRNLLTKTIPLCLITLVFTTGLILFSGSFLSYNLIKHVADTLAFDLEAEIFTFDKFTEIVHRLRLYGSALLSVGVALCIRRRWIQRQVSDLLFTLSSFKKIEKTITKALKSEGKIHLCPLIVILGIAAAVRLAFLFQPMRYDEAFTFINFASKPLWLGLSWYSTPNNHLFHTLLVHITCSLFGNQPWLIRLPALVAGILLVPASYMVIRSLYNDKHSALLASALVAVSSPLIEYSTNARGYTLVCLFFLLTLLLGNHVKNTGNPTGWFLFAVFSALGFYTIPVMLYPFGTVLIWLSLSAVFKQQNFDRNNFLKKLFISCVFVAILTFTFYLPVLVVSGVESIVANQFVTPIPWSSFINRIPQFLWLTWDRWNRDIPTVLVYIFGLGFLVSQIFHRRSTSDLIPITLAAVIWCTPVLLLQRVIPYTRVWLFLLPLYLGLAASGLRYLFTFIEAHVSDYSLHTFAVLAIILSVCLGANVVNTQSVYYSNETGTFRDAEAITIQLKDALKPGDGVLVKCPANAPLIYYFDLHDIPTEYFFQDLNSSNRVYVVVLSHWQRLEELMEDAGLEASDFFAPQLILRYESASVYQITRRE